MHESSWSDGRSWAREINARYIANVGVRVLMQTQFEIVFLGNR